MWKGEQFMIILFGAGICGRMALNDYGSNVAYFCDNHYCSEYFQNIPVITFEKLKEIYKEYEIIVTACNDESRREICHQLEENNIPHRIYKPKENILLPQCCLYIHGTFPFLQYELGKDIPLPRVYQTITMFRKTFELYRNDFEGHQMNIYVYLGDWICEAYAIAKQYHQETIFAYFTLYSLKDTIIPIPDFRSFIDREDYFYSDGLSEYSKAAETSWEDPRICWRGGGINEARMQLLWMSERFPQYFDFKAALSSKDINFISMTKQTKYKYLIDTRGNSWTDRVKLFFHLRRPLFLVDRPYQEWYFDMLVPWKHYIPVKEDLSDLVEAYEYMEAHPQKYDEICGNMKDFAQKYLCSEAVLKYVRDICLKYGSSQVHKT